MQSETEEIIELVSDAIVSLDHGLNIALFNPAAERLFGYAAEEIIGHPLSLILPEESRNLQALCTKAVRKAPRRACLTSMRRPVAGRTKDGSEKPLEISVQKHPPQSLFRFTVICSDVSVAVALTHELAKSEARLARAQAIAHIGNWEWDIVTGGLVWSDEIYRIFGRLPQEFEATFEAFLETIHPDDRQHVSDAIDSAVDNDTPYSIEHKIVCPDGEEKVVKEIGVVRRDRDGKAIRMDGTVQDITRSWQTTQELIEATRAARNADRVKSDFLASMSHELKTPLNAVLGFAQILAFDSEHPLSDKQITFVQHILDGGQHLLELVNQVLDLSSVEADRIDLSLENLTVNETVADCVALMAPLAKAQGIRVSNDLSDGPCFCLHADQMRLRQILINLLSNAIKYNRPGGTVVITGRETEHGFVRIFVKDTGIGIAEKDRANVFRMFNRLGTAADLGKDGTGIGINVTRGLVEKMAGRIGFESEEGVGSTFWVQLPLASNEEVLIWEERLRIGVDALDKDHQVIFSLLNKISQRSTDEQDLDEVIGELIDYTGYHFHREEAVMEACGYPDLQAHRDEHRRLIALVNDLANKWHHDRDREMLQQFREFLRDWFVNHIMKADAEIAGFISGKAYQIREAVESVG